MQGYKLFIVDITPSTGSRGRPYSKNCLWVADIIFIAATHVESVAYLKTDH